MHQSPSPFRSLTLKQRARFVRHHPTLSEQMLWHMLRSQRLGVRFVRQVPLLGRYIVDFLAPVVKLVVEVDGGSHSERSGLDARRDRALTRAGYTVLRVAHEDVVRELRKVRETIAASVTRAR